MNSYKSYKISPLGQQQLQFIGEIVKAELPLLFCGGFAEDAWLEGEVGREHHDIDVLAKRTDEERILATMQTLGYQENERFLVNGRFYKHLLARDGVVVDVVMVDEDQNGRQYIDIKNDDGVIYRAYLPQDSLRYEPQMLGDLTINTVNPVFQFWTRSVFQKTNRAPLRDKDVKILNRLQSMFGEVMTEPEIEIITEGTL
jgi:hypothetical protein